MQSIKTDLPGVILLEPQVFEDNRGWFMETYSKEKFARHGIDAEFIQDNHSMSYKKGVLRGIHFQLSPMAQGKLMRCTKGAILDVAVDLRKDSPTYKKWVSVVLSMTNRRMFFVPRGFGHAFLTLEDNTEVEYKVDSLYSPQHDRSIRYDDPDIAINWGTGTFILSDKDRNAPFLKDSDCNF